MNQEIFVDVRMSSYETFHNDEWMHTVDQVAKGTVFARPVFKLYFAWKSSGLARRLPLLMVQVMKGSLETFARRHNPTLREVTSTALGDRIAAEMGDTQLTSEQYEKLRKTIGRVQAEIGARSIGDPLRVDAEAIWRSFLTEKEFKATLSKSEQVAYVSVYFAYETFLTQCVALAKKDPDYEWQRAKEFGKDFDTAFGTPMCDLCCRDEQVVIAALVRNAIAHSGGRITDKLRKRNHGFTLVGEHADEIAITAPNTTALYHGLKDRALALVQHGVTLAWACP